RGRKTGMAVGAADQAELKGVRAQLLFQRQPSLERRPRVAAREHFLGGLLKATQVYFVPDFEIGEFIVGRQSGMGFARSFGLGDLNDRLTAGPRLGVGTVDRFAAPRFHGKHAAVAEITIMREGEQTATGLVFIRLHPLPELLRVGAV